tara:strand:- start:277 stop:1377 length:1101 start_codon:yes stop_codon:yes gene_type:complete
MNITFTIATLDKGGAERVLTGLANKFSEDGFNVRIIYMHPKAIAYPINSNILIRCMNVDHFTENHSIFEKIINFTNRVFLLRREINSKPTDLIISFGDSISVSMLIATFFTFKKKIKKIVSVRNNPSLNAGTLVRRLVTIFYKGADAVVVQTSYAEKVLATFAKNVSMVQINNPVKTLYKSNPYNLSKKKYTFLSLGRYHNQKRHDILLEAFKILSKKHKNISLCIAGKDDGERNSLQNFINHSGLQDKVTLKNAVDDVYELILKSEVYVHPSEFEGMPNSVLEAMSCGLPSIVSNFDGVENIIEDKLTGILFTVNDKNSLVKQMENVLEDKKLRQSLSHNAFESITNNFDFDKIYNKWKNLINRL